MKKYVTFLYVHIHTNKAATIVTYWTKVFQRIVFVKEHSFSFEILLSSLIHKIFILLKMRTKKRILFHGEAKKDEKQILCKYVLNITNLATEM